MHSGSAFSDSGGSNKVQMHSHRVEIFSNEGLFLYKSVQGCVAGIRMPN